MLRSWRRLLLPLVVSLVLVSSQTCEWVGHGEYGYEQCAADEQNIKVAIKRSAQAAYEDGLLQLRKRYKAECSSGSPTEKECAAEKEEGFRLHAFDLSKSNRLPLSRPIPDIRPDTCGEMSYPNPKSTMTVVLVFYNEGTSTLLRTAQSCLDRTHPDLLKEILLVDDGNPLDDERVKKQMAAIEEFLTERPKVRMIRLDDHEGLIVAKTRGAQAATGDIVAFMDSHCEVGYGWAEPLVAAIEEDPKTVAVPLIDAVGWANLDYLPGDLMRGIMSWSLYFTWQTLTNDQLAARNPADPLMIPIMPGGLFAISRKFFEFIGYYDEGLKIWGGENLEMSLKVWMCGGRIEVLPCSRIGHIFKDVSHKFPSGHSVARNLNRVVEVWLPEYKHIYYDAFPTATSWGFGDVSNQVALRERLGDQCQNFSWFVENVFPDMFIPLNADDEDRNGKLVQPVEELPRVDYYRRSGRVVASKYALDVSLCLDTQAVEIASVPTDGAIISHPAILQDCKDVSDLQQWYHMKRTKQIVHIGLWTEFCLTVAAGGSVEYQKCKVAGDAGMKAQQWSLKSPGVLYNSEAKKCLQVSKKSLKLGVKKCSESKETQRFHFEIL